jgi:hypothetical protein
MSQNVRNVLVLFYYFFARFCNLSLGGHQAETGSMLM